MSHCNNQWTLAKDPSDKRGDMCWLCRGSPDIYCCGAAGCLWCCCMNMVICTSQSWPCSFWCLLWMPVRCSVTHCTITWSVSCNLWNHSVTELTLLSKHSAPKTIKTSKDKKKRKWVFKYLYINVHSSSVYSSQKVQAVHMSISGWMDKQIVCPYNGILVIPLRNEVLVDATTRMNLERSQTLKVPYLWPTDMKCLEWIGNPAEMESILVISTAWGREEWGMTAWWSQSLLCGGEEIHFRTGYTEWLHDIVNIPNATESYTFEQLILCYRIIHVEVVKFMLCEFYLKNVHWKKLHIRLFESHFFKHPGSHVHCALQQLAAHPLQAWEGK